MFELLVKMIRQKTSLFFALAWPTFLDRGDGGKEYESMQDDAAKDRIFDREHDRAVRFCRSLRFRRVGSTVWFAMASDGDHPSHKLVRDHDLPAAPFAGLDHTLSLFQQFREPYAIEQMLNPKSALSPDYLKLLHACIDQKGPADACWMGQNQDGNTILHVAVSMRQVKCIKWMLNHDFGIRLLHIRNRRGKTPLEQLEFELEKLRTQRQVNMMTVCMSDNFNGYTLDAVRCLILLIGLGTFESLFSSHGEIALLQMIRGCTCRKCISGVLSPRMAYALLCQADFGYDMMAEGFNDCSGSEWVLYQEHNLGYMPSRVLSDLRTNKSMRQGFINLWSHIAACLKAKKVPSISNVMEALDDAGERPPATKNYLEIGGTVESAFLSLCRSAGDGDHKLTFGDEIVKMPE